MEFYSTRPDELAHHGVKGMKWGVRRSRAQLARARGHGAKKSSKSGKQAAPEETKRTVRDMSDDELAKSIRRLQLERQYADLTRPPQKQKLFDGKKFVVGVMEQSGKKLAGDVLTYAGGKAINKAFGKDIINLKNDKKDDKKDD